MSAPGGTTIRDAMGTLLPACFKGGSQGAGGFGEKFVYSVTTLIADVLEEGLRQGINDRFPTRANADALPVLGNDRVIDRGLFESDASYRVRLQQAFDTWATAGSAWSVLKNLLALVTPFTPVWRTVNDSSVWDSINDPLAPLQGTPTWRLYANPANWNWDGLTQWWRFWTILYPGTTLVGSVTAASNASPIQITVAAHGLVTGNTVWIDGVNGNLGANGAWTITKVDNNNFTLNLSAGTGAWTSGGTVLQTTAATIWTPANAIRTASVKFGDGSAIGVSASPANVALMRKMVFRWQRAGSWCVWTLWSFDATAFRPTAPPGDPGLPDGTWGPWSKQVGYARVPTRSGNARFSDGAA